MQQRKQKKVKDFLRDNVNRQALSFLIYHMENESSEEYIRNGLRNKSNVFIKTVMKLSSQCAMTRLLIGKEKASNNSYADSIKAKLELTLNAPLIDNNLFTSIYQKGAGVFIRELNVPESAFDAFIMQYPLEGIRKTKRERRRYDFFRTFPAMIGAIRQNSKVSKYPMYYEFDVPQRIRANILQKSYEKVKSFPKIAELSPTARADMLEKLFVDAYNSNKPLNYDNIFQCLLGLPIEQPEPAPKPKKKPKRKAKQRQQPQQRKPAK